MMEPVYFYYRSGDVGDGARWEAVCGDVDGNGATPADAAADLASKLADRDDPKTDEEAESAVVVDGAQSTGWFGG